MKTCQDCGVEMPSESSFRICHECRKITFLKIESLIADKGIVTATANRELDLGGWTMSHDGEVNRINVAIDALFSKLTVN